MLPYMAYMDPMGTGERHYDSWKHQNQVVEKYGQKSLETYIIPSMNQPVDKDIISDTVIAFNGSNWLITSLRDI